MTALYIAMYELVKLIVRKCISHIWMTALTVHADSPLKLVTENFI